LQSAVFDIETTSLGAVGAGIILCVCIRPMQTKRTRTYHIGQFEFEADNNYGFLEREERALLEITRLEFSNYHILIGHNVERFDWPYLKSRAFRRGLEWNLFPGLYDTLKAFRRTKYLTVMNGFGKPSGGLAMVADFGGAKQEKTAIYPVEWWESIWGNKMERIGTLQEITNHCQADVRMNAQVFDYLWAADMRATIKRAL
jgi:uncharacterized protein YprB with RNaseH-like and TPR domain